MNQYRVFNYAGEKKTPINQIRQAIADFESRYGPANRIAVSPQFITAQEITAALPHVHVEEIPQMRTDIGIAYRTDFVVAGKKGAA